MSIPRSDSSRSENALIAAHTLTDMGIPVFRGRLTKDGDPDRLDKRWMGWQNAKPSHRSVELWKPGEALCAVTGYAFDVLDYDPRNGGQLSFKRLSNELGEDGPEIYWTVHTPSGGQHLYIAPLGIGKHTGFLPGLDLQGGKSDGTSRGFVFLPPTVRPSKVTGERSPYYFKEQPADPEDDPGCEALRYYISEGLGQSGGRVPSSNRESLAKLRRECITAEAGGQRNALLRYVHELERQGVGRDTIMSGLQELTQEMPVYNKRNPWYPATGKKSPSYHLRGLLHKDGEVIPDASPEELEGLGELRGEPQRSGLIQYVHEIEEKPLSWLWYGRIAFGEMTLVDGEKGKGKSFVTYDIIARATNGWPMPDQDQAECDPIKVILFTDEGGWDTTIRPRLRASGADLRRVARVSPATVRRNWGLPEGARHIGKAIQESGASLAIFDPITDMLGEKTQSHNDASVRLALGPLAQELSKYGCAGLCIRHFNKAVGAGARNRGSGSTAFQNRARVHAITGELPSGAQYKFGIAIVDTNLTSREGIDGVVGYNIVDSDVPTGDRQGTYHGRVEWGEVVTGIDANMLADGGPRRPGPAAVRRQEVVDLLAEIFDEKDTWPASEVLEMLRNAGASTTNDVLREARQTLGIRATADRQKGKRGVSGWLWTTAKIRSRDGND